MQDFEAISKKYMTGDRAETLKAAAASPEGQRLARMVDAKAVEDAARRGDTEALGGILRSVLATEEGRALAARLTDALGGGR